MSGYSRVCCALYCYLDHQGRVLAAVDSFATGKPVFLTSLPKDGVTTVYSVIGDSFAYLSMLSLLVLIGASVRRHPSRSQVWQRL